jgi:hypothetical protein
VQSLTQAGPVSKGRLWTGRIISAVVVLFLLFDSITKVMKVRAVIEASAQLGYPVNAIVTIGIILLVCTAFYIIPQTSGSWGDPAHRISWRRGCGEPAHRQRDVQYVLPYRFRRAGVDGPLPA